jgi:hypothetical protein
MPNQTLDSEQSAESARASYEANIRSLDRLIWLGRPANIRASIDLHERLLESEGGPRWAAMSITERRRAAALAAASALISEVEEANERFKQAKFAIERIRQIGVDARALATPRRWPGALWRRWHGKLSRALDRRHHASRQNGPLATDALQVDRLKRQLESLAEALSD